MSQITEIETYDLEQGLVVLLSENVFAQVLHIFPDWLEEDQYRINFSNKLFDDKFDSTKTWKVLNVFSGRHSQA